MIPYASRTGTRRNLDALRRHGFRLLISATGAHRSEGFPYGIDNGAFTWFQRGEPFREDPFLRLLDSHGAGADWVVVPDIVAGGLESLAFSLGWAPRLAGLPRPLLAVQDGMAVADVAPHVGPELGIFVGGSTDFKEWTMSEWGRLARQAGAYFHVGRVNSKRRISMAAAAGADSFDGTSATRFSVNAAMVSHAAAQLPLFAPKDTT